MLYAVSAVYFAGVMVRLMLTLTPCVCVLAAIAFSTLFERYLKEEDVVDAERSEAAPAVANGADSNGGSQRYIVLSFLTQPSLRGRVWVIGRIMGSLSPKGL